MGTHTSSLFFEEEASEDLSPPALTARVLAEVLVAVGAALVALPNLPAREVYDAAAEGHWVATVVLKERDILLYYYTYFSSERVFRKLILVPISTRILVRSCLFVSYFFSSYLFNSYLFTSYLFTSYLFTSYLFTSY